MFTPNNAELAFLSVLGNPGLTKKVLKIYASKTFLFSETFHPHLNLMWNAYIGLLKKYKEKFGLELRKDIIAAGLAEAVQAETTMPEELKQKCDMLLQKFLNDDVPDEEHGERLVKTLMGLDANRRLLVKINGNSDLIALQQSLDSAKRTMAILDEDKPQDTESAGFMTNPLRDIRKLARKTVKMPTGINYLDDISSGGGREGDLWLILGAPSGGKCLGFGTPVLMYSGEVKPVQDIKEEELVMGPDSKPRKVAGLARGRSKMYRVKMHRGDSFVCNEDHILTLASSCHNSMLINGTRVMPGGLVDISVKDYLKLSKHKQIKLKALRTGVEFPAREKPRLDPYFVGLYLGDGSSKGSCCITTADQCVVDYCTAYVKALGFKCTDYRPKGSDKVHSLHFSRTTTYDRKGARNIILPEVLINGEKAIADSYKLASREDRLKLLAGIVDADGYAHHGGIDLVLKGKRLAEDVTFVARSLGYAVTLRSCIKKCCNTGAVGTYYRMNIGGYFDELPLRVERRKVKRVSDRINPQHVGFALEELPEDDYYGFTLDGDGRFLLGDFTVTHNTVMCTQYACAQAMLGKNTLWVTYEQSMEGDIAERMIANITDTSLDLIRDIGFDNLPEDIQNKFMAAVAGVDDRLTSMDMTKAELDPQDPSDYGGAMSIWKQFKLLKADGHAPKTVILDWFGSMMSKIAGTLGMDLSKNYRFLAQQEINNLIKFAREEKILIIVMHQLDVKAASARPTFLADATHAQDMHNMQNFFDMVAIIGKKDVNNICYFSNPKARKGGNIVRTLHMIGEKSRFVMEDGWLPNSDGNFYKPGSSRGDNDFRGAAEEYAREIE